MKKFLEVLVDEDGKFHFSTDEVFTTEEEFAAEDRFAQMAHMEEYDRLLRRLIHDMTEFMWKNQDQQVSQAVRSLSIAEILGCAEPYEHAEEFWNLMMFHTIPQFEHFAAAIKKRYGFDDRSVHRPYIGASLPDTPDFLSFPIQTPLGKMAN